jgi:hypothetical protein
MGDASYADVSAPPKKRSPEFTLAGSLSFKESMQNMDRTNEVRFQLQLRRKGHQWFWAIHNSQDHTIASGTAPSVEVAESAAEEIAGEKLERQFI